MTKFDIFQIEDLKNYLYHSYIHDAKIETLIYDRANKILKIEAFNSIHDIRIRFTFAEVKIMLSISGAEQGSTETIISLSVEEDYSYLQNCTKIGGDCLNGCLYLLFQTFSGDELHIASENVLIEQIT